MNDIQKTIEELRNQIPQAMLRDRFRLRRRLNRMRKLDSDKRNREVEELTRQLQKSMDLAVRRKTLVPTLEYPADLPVNQRRDEIADMIRKHQVLVVCGETGSGKSTQLPKICIQAGQGIFGKIGHTQPRRIAARSVAARVAEELKVPLGQQVGFKIRFSDQTNDTSIVKLMTDGILLAETQADRFMEEYDTIIIDEAHERSLNIDFLMGYLKTILPRRPDLKLIITSATIDAERFSDYFSNATGPAPIIEVSGRSYPVEMVYRPLEIETGGDDALFEGIHAAVRELSEIDTGDMLIFLPTEKDIRTATKKLRGLDIIRSFGRATEILPLYARLSVAEQNKIFHPGKSRRIVLATNVAESSLTVPRIKYVIDTGTARISRYSARSKIQRLPIEKISQASANQRAGRCGRLGPGICIRLFSEEDFLSREPFTTPEIRRTNLASVILQSKSMHFGDVDKIQFLDPPRPEAIRDGYKTLFEIGATDIQRELTAIGNRIKKFPCDPRISRMILAANEEGVVADVLIIAAALEVQDVRDRPVEKQKQADSAHEKFLDGDSDFITHLKIWDFYHEQKKKLSNNQLRKALQQNFISFNRMREWLEVFRQLKELCVQQKIKIGPRRNEYDRIHRSLLSGILSGIATRGEKHSYQGAGGMTFFLWPGSGLAGQSPKWVLGSEMVETSKRFLRNVARIQPGWIEPLGKHLTTKSHSDPHWHEKSEQVMANEKVSLFGLVIVPRRAVPYGKIDPDACRTLFIEEGLISQQMCRPFSFLEKNRQVITEAELLAQKTRRRDLIVETATIFRFYDERLPEHVIDGVSLHRWLKEDPAHEKQICLTSEDLVASNPDSVDELFPANLPSNRLNLALSYAFEPGNRNDGVTTEVPVVALSRLNQSQLEWLVPGLVEEKIAALIRSLPKSKRRVFVPAPEKARVVKDQIVFGEGDFLSVVARCLSKLGEEPISPEDFDLDKLGPHLRMNIAVKDEDGEILEESRQLAELQEKYCDQQNLELQEIENTTWHADGIRRWDFEEIPANLVVSHGGIELPAHPAILDKGENVSLRLVSSASLACMESKFGVMRLAVIREKKRLKSQIRWLPEFEKYSLAAGQMGRVQDFRSGIIDLIAKRAFVDSHPNLPTSKGEFEGLFENSVEAISIATQEIAGLLPRFFESYQQLQSKVAGMSPSVFGEILAPVKQQLARLFGDQFWVKTPWKWLERFPVYFQSACRRLEKLTKSSLPEQLEKQKVLNRYYSFLDEKTARHVSQGIYCEELSLFRWMIEELSVSLFSQQLGTCVPVSEKRLDKQMEKVS